MSNQEIKNRFILPAVCVGGIAALVAVGASVYKPNLAKCNAGDPAACVEAYKLKSNHSRITNTEWIKAFTISEAKRVAEEAELEKKRQEAVAQLEAERKERLAKMEAAEARRKAEIAARGEWIYGGYTDQATGRRAKTASLTSKNSMNFGFPYSGTQYGRFIVRNHPRYGVDAYLKIEQGQLLCNSYSDTNVLIRFDNGAASAYSCTGASDHSTEFAFITNVARLEGRMKTAKKMFITVSVYQEGSRTWEFNVKGYDRSKV
ncbi:hypothetical protein [Synechococcus sp. A15-44]|uniref:hypothetical protein n=1 Tax=Synechococcus sp. A15-44 TaxID=1050646 RepID=UPI00164522FA|nr:hypothetical protein [Synechococcus sp. A15-44]QNI65701.1 hypothetical protein SynA1544_02785 [Synechococcus sp. A15-44]